MVGEISPLHSPPRADSREGRTGQGIFEHDQRIVGHGRGCARVQLGSCRGGRTAREKIEYGYARAEQWVPWWGL
jgi:hypothetical protein